MGEGKAISYQVSVGTDHEAIVLRVDGRLDVPAGRHLLEIAKLATGRLGRAVLIDLHGVSATAGAARLLAPKELQRLRGTVSVRRAPAAGWDDLRS